MTEKADSDVVRLKAIKLRYEPPPTITIPLDYDHEASIEFAVQYTGITPVTREVRVSQTASLHLRYPRPQLIVRVLDSVQQLRNFLSLAMGRPVAILSVTGLRDDYIQPGGIGRRPIEIFYEIPHNPDPPSRALHPVEMLFTLSEATPDIATVLRAWLARQEILAPVFNLYFGMLYHPSMYLDVRFLASAQAIETYDFRTRDPYELPPEQHEERLAAVLSEAPEAHREWLETRLTNSNVRALRSRIRNLMNECSSVRDKVVGATSGARRGFVERFLVSRNYYTHYDPELERRAATGTALYLLTLQLQTLIEMSMLRELGFTCEAIDAVFERANRYARIELTRSQVA